MISRYMINRCPGRISTVEENVVGKTDHSHAGDARNKEKRIALSEIRQKAAQSNSPPRRVIRSATAAISTEAAIEMSKYESLARNVRRIRQKANTTPAQPQSLAELTIDGEFAQTIKGDSFVLYDNEDAANRIVMFTTKDNLNFMIMCDDLYMDGTFAITPPLFKQVYSIHGEEEQSKMSY